MTITYLATIRFELDDQAVRDMPNGADWVAGFVARSFAERPVETVCGETTGEVVSLCRVDAGE